MNSLGRMYPSLSASELSNIILKGKFNKCFSFLNTGCAFLKSVLFTQSQPYGVRLEERREFLLRSFCEKCVIKFDGNCRENI